MGGHFPQPARREAEPSVLKLRELPVPKPRPHEVLIAIHTAGIGTWDTAIRDGSWRPPRPPKVPLIPGVDGVGTVVAKGARVRRFAVGDTVYAYEFGNPRGGFYAQFTVADAEHVSLVPKGLDLRAAGAAAATGLTAMQGIDQLELRPRHTILIFGATGAVGTLAVQFAAQRGAYVIATASGKAAQRLVKRLGAKQIIDGRSMESIEQLRKLAPDGLDRVLARRTFRLRSFDAVASPREFAKLQRRIDSGRIRVPIAAVYPLARAADVHRRLPRGHVLGRMVFGVRR